MPILDAPDVPLGTCDVVNVDRSQRVQFGVDHFVLLKIKGESCSLFLNSSLGNSVSLFNFGKFLYLYSYIFLPQIGKFSARSFDSNILLAYSIIFSKDYENGIILTFDFCNIRFRTLSVFQKWCSIAVSFNAVIPMDSCFIR